MVTTDKSGPRGPWFYSRKDSNFCCNHMHDRCSSEQRPTAKIYYDWSTERRHVVWLWIDHKSMMVALKITIKQEIYNKQSSAEKLECELLKVEWLKSKHFTFPCCCRCYCCCCEGKRERVARMVNQMACHLRLNRLQSLMVGRKTTNQTKNSETSNLYKRRSYQPPVLYKQQ